MRALALAVVAAAALRWPCLARGALARIPRQLVDARLYAPDAGPPPGRGVTLPGSALAFQLASYPRGAPVRNLSHALYLAVDGTVVVCRRAHAVVRARFRAPAARLLGGGRYPLQVDFLARSDGTPPPGCRAADRWRGGEVLNRLAGARALVVFFAQASDRPGRVSDFLAAALATVSQVSRHGQVASTAALNHTHLQYHLARSDVYQYNASSATPPCDDDVSVSLVVDSLFVDPRDLRAVTAVIGHGSPRATSRPVLLHASRPSS